MLWGKHSKKASDEEIVERARTNLKYVERWGRWWAAFHWIVVISYTAILISVINLVQAWGNNLAQNRGDLWLGAIFGLFAGASLYHVSHGVVEAILSRLPDERDRLLLKYHDALIECIRASGTGQGLPAEENPT